MAKEPKTRTRSLESSACFLHFPCTGQHPRFLLPDGEGLAVWECARGIGSTVKAGMECQVEKLSGTVRVEP